MVTKLRVGDTVTVKSGHGNSCCFRDGEIFVIEEDPDFEPEDPESLRLGFKPRCWDEHHDFHNISELDEDSIFILANGPW